MLVCAPFHSTSNAPVGMAYISAWLEQHDHRCPLKDLNIDAKFHLLSINTDNDNLRVIEDLFALARRTYLGEALGWSWLDPEGTQGVIERIKTWPNIIQRDFWLENGINRLEEDIALSQISVQLKEWLESQARELVDSCDGWIGLSAVITNLPFTIFLSKLIKNINPNIFIVLGGPYVTNRNISSITQTLTSIDAAIPEPAFEPLLALLNSRKSGIYNHSIPGVWNQKTIFQPPYIGKLALDILPPANWEYLPMNRYESGFRLLLEKDEIQKYRPTIPIIASRGCSYSQCNFCHNVVDHPKYLMRSPEKIVEEIQHQINTIGSCGFFFTDDEFGGSNRQLSKLCSEINRLDIEINFFAWMRLDRIERKILESLYCAGLRQIFLGVEGIDDKILYDLGKGYSSKDALSRLTILEEFCTTHPDLGYTFNFIVDHPNETLTSARNTLKCVTENPHLFVGRLAACCQFHLYEGTPAFNDFGKESFPCLDPILPHEFNSIKSFRYLLPKTMNEERPRRIDIWNAIGEISRFDTKILSKKKNDANIIYD